MVNSLASPIISTTTATTTTSSNPTFSTTLELPVGLYEFKFLVDNQWQCSNEYEKAMDEDGHLINFIELDGGEEDTDSQLASTRKIDSSNIKC